MFFALLMILAIPLVIAIMLVLAVLGAVLAAIGGLFVGPLFVFSKIEACQNICCAVSCPLTMVAGAVAGFFGGLGCCLFFGGAVFCLYV